MANNRLLVVLIVTLIFTFSAAAEWNTVYEEGKYNISITENQTTSYEIMEIDQEKLPEKEKIGFYRGFKIESDQAQTFKLEIEEFENWTKKYIESSPESFGGEQTYNPGLITLLKGEELKAVNLYYDSENIYQEISPGEYFITVTGVQTPYNAHVNSDRECHHLYNSEKNTAFLETCHSNLTYLYKIDYIYLAKSVFGLILAILSIISIHKLRGRKKISDLSKEIDDLTAKIKKKDYKNQKEILRLLLKADEAAINQNISKSRNYLEEAKLKIRDK